MTKVKNKFQAKFCEYIKINYLKDEVTRNNLDKIRDVG